MIWFILDYNSVLRLMLLRFKICFDLKVKHFVNTSFHTIPKKKAKNAGRRSPYNNVDTTKFIQNMYTCE